MADPTQGASAMTLEESDAAEAQTQKPDLTKVVAEGDDIPERYRGKSVADIIKLAGGTEDALKLSEQARINAEAILRATATAAPAAAPAPVVEEPKEYTAEEIAAMYENEPLKAIEVMQNQALRRAEKNLEVRLGPLVNGSAQSAENGARTKYGEEFALFGEEITRIAAGIPNAKNALANPQAWDDIVAYVRGRPGNMEKLFEKKNSAKIQAVQETARQEQVESVGFTESSSIRRSAPTSVAQLDPLQREIADKLDMSYEDYVKWSKIS